MTVIVFPMLFFKAEFSARRPTTSSARSRHSARWAPSDFGGAFSLRVLRVAWSARRIYIAVEGSLPWVLR